MEKKLTLHGRQFKLMIPHQEIIAAIDKTAQQLNRDFADATEEDAPIILCTLSGAIIFFSELLQRINFPCEVKALKLSSYTGTTSTGVVKAESALSNLEGRRIIVVEDIVDTGLTIEAMYKLLLKLGVTEVRICTMLLKPEVYKKQVPLDYVSMEIPNRFIVGFGLDYDELGRNSRDIYVLDE